MDKKMVNEFLTTLLGGCNQLDGLVRDSGYLCCCSCNKIVKSSLPRHMVCHGPIDFYTSNGFFKLWDFIRKEKWYSDFRRDFLLIPVWKGWSFNEDMVDPARLAEAVYVFKN